MCYISYKSHLDGLQLVKKINKNNNDKKINKTQVDSFNGAFIWTFYNRSIKTPCIIHNLTILQFYINLFPPSSIQARFLMKTEMMLKVLLLALCLSMTTAVPAGMCDDPKIILKCTAKQILVILNPCLKYDHQYFVCLSKPSKFDIEFQVQLKKNVFFTFLD